MLRAACSRHFLFSAEVLLACVVSGSFNASVSPRTRRVVATDGGGRRRSKPWIVDRFPEKGDQLYLSPSPDQGHPLAAIGAQPKSFAEPRHETSTRCFHLGRGSQIKQLSLVKIKEALRASWIGAFRHHGAGLTARLASW
jgi:hypothetical protein